MYTLSLENKLQRLFSEKVFVGCFLAGPTEQTSLRDAFWISFVPYIHGQVIGRKNARLQWGHCGVAFLPVCKYINLYMITLRIRVYIDNKHDVSCSFTASKNLLPFNKSPPNKNRDFLSTDL